MAFTRCEIGRARVVFTDRHGGVSADRFATCNLGDHVGDGAAVVQRNRHIVAHELGLSSAQWVWLRQVHGARLVEIGAPSPDGVLEADGAVTSTPGVVLTVMTADCAPIALVGERGIGVVHAGWAGLLAGVVEAGTRAVRVLDDGPISAVLGPCIQAARYEFREADLVPLVARFGPTVRSTTAWGTPAFDLPRAVHLALAEAGVDAIDDVGVCTHSSADHYSHRRDGVTGRQALVAWMAR